LPTLRERVRGLSPCSARYAIERFRRLEAAEFRGSDPLGAKRSGRRQEIIRNARAVGRGSIESSAIECTGVNQAGLEAPGRTKEE
jgi:hypothetical protein